MKYLVLVLVIVAVLWFARSRVRKPPPPRRDAPRTPQDIVACAHCGVHLPSAEAVNGADGVYCSEAHRLAHDRKAG